MFSKRRDTLRIPEFDVEKRRQAHNLSMWHRYKLAIGLSLTLLITMASSIFFVPFIQGATPAYKIEQVSRGPLQVVANATGLLQSSLYNLSFQNPTGTISEIDVQQGQSVTTGQVLARLDTSTLQASIIAAQTAVSTARNNVRVALAHAGNTTAAINSAIAVAEASFNAARANQNATDTQANASVDNARVTLAADQRNLDAAYEAARLQLQAARAQLEQSLTSCQTSANTADTPTPTPTPIPIPTSSTSTPVSNTPAPTSSTSTSTNVQSLLKICQQAARTQYKQATANTRSSTVSAEGQLQKDQRAFYQTLANADLSLTNSSGQTDITHHQIIAASENADRTAAASQVISAQGQFQVALSQLDIARRTLANATLVAPHNGIVTAINGTIGGLPGITADIAYGTTGSAAGGAFIQLVDLSRITTFLLNVNEADIAKVRAGQKVDFTLKAYANRHFTGIVEAISPNGTTTNGVTYPVIVTIDPQSIEGATLLPNMTLDATITIVDNPRDLRVPVDSVHFADTVTRLSTNSARALVSKQAIDVALKRAHEMLATLNESSPELKFHEPFPSFVIEQSSISNKYLVRPVVLGLSDGRYYEVLQGLTENEHIITGSNASKT